MKSGKEEKSRAFILLLMLAALVFLFPGTPLFAAEGNFSLLHSFEGGAQGAVPWSQSLATDGSTLYGMTSGAGSSDNGIIYSLGIDGSGFTVLHNLSYDTDGGEPQGHPTLSGETLYGMAAYGGSGNKGTIFSLGTDGSGFTVLHSFSGADGATPCTSLALSGDTLYGMTTGGGDSDQGTIFSIGTDGSGFAVLHSFTGADGANPYDAMILSGETLYGMVSFGGIGDYGTIFSIQTDGSGFTVLHNFTGDADDGSMPFYGAPTLFGSFLYFATGYGGAFDAGAVCRYDVAPAAPDEEPRPCFLRNLF